MREAGEVGSVVEVAAAAVSHLWPPLLHSYWEGRRDILLTNIITNSIEQSISHNHLFKQSVKCFQNCLDIFESTFSRKWLNKTALVLLGHG